MHRYIALTWNNRAEETTTLAGTLAARIKSVLPDWQCVLTTSGMQVYQTAPLTRSFEAYLLNGNSGIVLGKLFSRSDAPKCGPEGAFFDEQETQEIHESEGRYLINRYWGRYVMLLQEKRLNEVRILRDPTGAMPCFMTRFRGIDIICSHVEDCASLGVVDTTVNWDHIAEYLWFPRLVTNRTGLQYVKQIRAGECFAVSGDNTTSRFYWDPGTLHGVHIVEDRQHAMELLRTTIQRCVAAWASCYSSLLHEVSGGLDSAVVLSCLSERPGEPNILCENFFTEDAEGDERVFARKAASLAKVELIETPLCFSGTLEAMLDWTKVATPTLTTLVPEYQQNREEMIKARRIEAVFSGQGGDHFFQQEADLLIASEYAWHHGVRPGLVSVITDTSRFTGTPLWSVIGQVLGSTLLRQHHDPYEKKLKPPPFISAATMDAIDPGTMRHPWVDNAKHLPGSKVRQVLNIVDSQNLFHFPSHCSDIVHPLISQPLIELCLQIPSYVLTYGGIGRALVRDAFAGKIPPEIANRATKGSTTGYIDALLIQSISFLREFLLDGFLVEHGVLDRAKTEAALTETALTRDPHLLFPVLSVLQAEVWLTTWKADRKRTAA